MGGIDPAGSRRPAEVTRIRGDADREPVVATIALPTRFAGSSLARRERAARPGPGSRGVMPIALVTSVAVHAFILSLEIGSPRATALQQRRSAPPEALRGIVPRAAEEERAAERAATEAPPAELARFATPPGGAPPDPEEDPGAPTSPSRPLVAARDPLSPAMRDVRLSARRDILLPMASAAEERAAELDARLRPFNDSIMAAAESARRAADWTLVDADGNRWGASPGRIHLGALSLSPCKVFLDPFTCAFRVEPRHRAALEERVNTHDEIRRQERSGEIARVQAERLRAIREGRERERP